MSNEEKSEMLDWYWYLVMLSSWALGAYDFESYQFYEDWRRDIKGGVLA